MMWWFTYTTSVDMTSGTIPWQQVRTCLPYRVDREASLSVPKTRSRVHAARSFSWIGPPTTVARASRRLRISVAALVLAPDSAPPSAPPVQGFDVGDETVRKAKTENNFFLPCSATSRSTSSAQREATRPKLLAGSCDPLCVLSQLLPTG
jgi:hypothetical protein